MGKSMGDQTYLIRYGVMSHVGRFIAPHFLDLPLERGRLVVLQTDRGIELGEVLIALDGKPEGANLAEHEAQLPSEGDPLTEGDSGKPSRVLREASLDDLSRSRSAEESRTAHLSLCERILGEGGWPWELVDVEPLLDGRSTVIHYLGPHRLDVTSLRARFRVECDIDIVLQPVGPDVEEHFDNDDADAEADDHGCGSCGCEPGGGCGSKPVAQARPEVPTGSEPGGCAPTSHAGCSSCGIGSLMAERRRPRPDSTP
jgi:hypothetical protein